MILKLDVLLWMQWIFLIVQGPVPCPGYLTCVWRGRHGCDPPLSISLVDFRHFLFSPQSQSSWTFGACLTRLMTEDLHTLREETWWGHLLKMCTRKATHILQTCLYQSNPIFQFYLLTNYEHFCKVKNTCDKKNSFCTKPCPGTHIQEASKVSTDPGQD